MLRKRVMVCTVKFAQGVKYVLQEVPRALVVRAISFSLGVLHISEAHKQTAL